MTPALSFAPGAAARRLSCPGRPDFPTPDAYLADALAAEADGREPWPPATTAELGILADRRPDLFARYLPSKEERRRMGLPRDFGALPRPIPRRLMSRFLVTLLDDPQTTAALRFVLDSRDGGPAPGGAS